jgi:YD repeat-containing protein
MDMSGFFPLGAPAPIEILFLTRRYAYDANGNTQYLGLAKPGTAESSPGWVIIKYTYDESNRTIQANLAGGSNSPNKVWKADAGTNTYATYEYS